MPLILNVFCCLYHVAFILIFFFNVFSFFKVFVVTFHWCFVIIQIQELNAGQKLHKKMMQFKTSVPLMGKLQNESLRERHWKHLMSKTGHQFNTGAQQFHLSDMFAMNLFKYQVRYKIEKNNNKNDRNFNHLVPKPATHTITEKPKRKQKFN